MKLKILEMTFRSTEEFQRSLPSMRGFFASRFNDLIELHNHNTDQFVYSYPLVQYKFIGKTPLLMGINEGTEILKEIFDKFDSVNLNGKEYEIVERTITIRKEEFGLSNKIYFYEFLTPWFALSQKNHDKFKFARNNEGKAELLRNILKGNLLSMSKSLGYTVPGQIKCDVDLLPTKSKYKDTEIVSFDGGFAANFVIPDYLGIGKSVSKGFGMVRKIQNNEI
ncbi:MAG: CRISPR-associated endonuclease Cas6 [Methanosarcina sp.]